MKKLQSLLIRGVLPNAQFACFITISGLLIYSFELFGSKTLLGFMSVSFLLLVLSVVSFCLFLFKKIQTDFTDKKSTVPPFRLLVYVIMLTIYLTVTDICMWIILRHVFALVVTIVVLINIISIWDMYKTVKKLFE